MKLPFALKRPEKSTRARLFILEDFLYPYINRWLKAMDVIWAKYGLRAIQVGI